MHGMMKFGLISLCCLGIMGGCSKQEQPYRKPTTVVKGRIMVDGQPPGSPVKVTCYPEGGLDTEHPSRTSALTQDDGVFHLSTYEAGDGIPEGEYTLTFYWGAMNLVSMSYGGPDQLKGRYAKPEKSEIKIQVTGSKSMDLGTLELTTK